MKTGLALIVVGVWIGAQILKGGALDRLIGSTSSTPQTPTDTTPNPPVTYAPGPNPAAKAPSGAPAYPSAGLGTHGVG